ncbi:redox-sensitive transcriptional activator SoxR [Actinoplanes sp. L3-i22]|uniref:redox-sensitive transcriptional activator SoxR n=1 Tax=Actinoplanes sp. L3-i22 TaxID=2836373 RepID=UPI001C740809|nr:redox-sensitive transcriptional activator SoxR [Actinoplanes sp. L3-i22]BCY15525.1 redox-sensitive transcriptional activator SoxR [Actinoplanes sp. L3-i22]
METLTIGEMAARSGVAPSALRYYEREGLLHAARTGGNQRRYERADLRRIAFIKIAQQVGVSLDEIRGALAELPENRTPTKADWSRLSSHWRHRLDERIHMMERLRDQLTGCIGCGCLSLQRCSLINPRDRLASRGTGPQMILNPPAADPSAGE